jgi:hypothetical protein
LDENGIYGLHWIKQQAEAVRIHWMSIHRQRKKRASRLGMRRSNPWIELSNLEMFMGFMDFHGISKHRTSFYQTSKYIARSKIIHQGSRAIKRDETIRSLT